MKKNDTAKLAEIRDYGFEVLSAPRHRCGGGIAVVYRHDLSVTHNRKIEKFSTFEVMEITIQSDKNLMRFVNVYRAPYSKKHRFTMVHFLEEFEQYLQTASCKNGTLILVGDFNIHVEKEDDSYAQRFHDLLDEYNLKQRVPHIPTHCEGGTLDLMIIDHQSDLTLSEPAVIKLGTTSDHFLVRAEIGPFTAQSDQKRTKVINYRKYNDIDVDTFRSDLMRTGITDCSNFTSLDEAVSLLDTTLSNLMNKHCPVTIRTVKVKHMGANWFDDDLRKMRTRRRAVERRKRKHPSADNRMNYIRICRSFDKLVWVKKKAFYQKSLESSKDNSKALFKKINRLLGTEEACLPRGMDDGKLAEDFKEFFTDKISTIRSKIESDKDVLGCPGTQLHQNAEHSIGASFERFSMMSEEDIAKLIDSMSDKFCSLDCVPTWLLKKCLPELSPLLNYIINTSLTSGSFPTHLKSAILMPTLKSNDLDRDTLSSYRPVSNLSFISKVLEKCALRQLSEYLESNKLMCHAQSGYRQHHSCETLLVRMFDDINSSIAQKQAVALVLLDLSAAFDTIDHEMLATKLSSDYGIGAEVLAWITSYLECRTFSVKINNSRSTIGALLFGVPQGSLLGPILFILYTKDLEKIANRFGLTIQLYADDSQLYISFNLLDKSDLNVKLELIKECLTEIKLWMVQHFMKLNENKTQFILIGKKAAVDKFKETTLNLSGTTIQQTDFKKDSAKSLGVKLDSDLSMKRQVNDVKRKCYWSLTNLGNFGHFLTENLKISLVKTLILSKLDYCNALYIGLNVSILKKLQSTINSSIRFIYNIRDWSTDLSPYYKRAHILPIQLRIKYKICLLVHKSLNDTAPPYLRQLIKLYCEEPSKQSLRSYSDQRLLLRPQITETKASRRMYSYTAPIIWNSLSVELRSIEDTDRFKRDLKTHFFNFIDVSAI